MNNDFVQRNRGTAETLTAPRPALRFGGRGKMNPSGASLVSLFVRSSLAVAAICSSAAVAQEAREPEQSTSGVAAEIVVTAQKREQRLQDVPISVTAISAQTLQDSGVRDIKE